MQRLCRHASIKHVPPIELKIKMAKQSKKDREFRLSEGRCPIHGGWMGQIDGWYYPRNSAAYTIVECGRNDCNVRAKAFSVLGPCELLPEFGFLLEQGAEA